MVVEASASFRMLPPLLVRVSVLLPMATAPTVRLPVAATVSGQAGQGQRASVRQVDAAAAGRGGQAGQDGAIAADEPLRSSARRPAVGQRDGSR
ncbi:hypothetical protein Sp245p_31080 (plasmid) [Azospirillum baldaniorum]|uniref:hypothetical protein n=1 Tax=Azospirillum baldaniorum TaxID=1064539 RepID=UPI000D601699|nr:hypothetical protein [Azospirillum baldaniorum]AWJ94239.1 hypothetical protein Sp245p_31080 [Azospirillum baldaniorum]